VRKLARSLPEEAIDQLSRTLAEHLLDQGRLRANEAGRVRRALLLIGDRTQYRDRRGVKPAHPWEAMDGALGQARSIV
jgi:hypothetical protein